MRDSRVLELLWEKAEVGCATVSERGTFIDANERFCSIVEYSAAELIGMKFQEITKPSDARPDTEMARRVADGEVDHYRMVKTYIKKSGYPVSVDLIVWPIKRDDGGFDFFLAQVIPRVNVTTSTAHREVTVEPVIVLARFLSEHKGLIAKLIAGLVSLFAAITLAILQLAKAFGTGTP